MQSRKNYDNVGLQPTPRSPLAEKMWGKVCETHNFEPLSEQSLRNLAEANEALKKQALIIYLNHTSTKDVSVAISLILSHLTNARHFMGPAGMKHYDLKRDPVNGILLRSLRLLNIQVMPVVQQNDLESYSEEKRVNLLQKLKTRTQRFLQKPRSIYGITPEGTRNTKTGELVQGKSGLGKLEKYAPQNIKYLPIVIVYDKFSNQPQVVVGEALDLNSVLAHTHTQQLPKNENARAQKITDLLMFQLSRLLPENLRGFYRNAP